MLRLFRGTGSRPVGAAAVEYALIASAVGLFVIAILAKLATVVELSYVDSCTKTQLDMSTTTICIKKNG